MSWGPVPLGPCDAKLNILQVTEQEMESKLRYSLPYKVCSPSSPRESHKAHACRTGTSEALRETALTFRQALLLSRGGPFLRHPYWRSACFRLILAGQLSEKA